MLARAHFEAYLTVVWRVFGRVRQQVIDNLVQLVGVNPAHHALWLAVDGEVELVLGHQRLYAERRLLDVVHDVALGHAQPELARLRLAGLQDLLQKPHHALDVQLHQVVVGRL